MKKILLSSVALIGFTAGAMAADLPARRMAPVAPFAAVPVFTWTGFYAGVNAGYGFSSRNNNGFFGDNLTAPAVGGGAVAVTQAGGGSFFGTNGRDRNRDGFVGGGQIGYNYQFTPGSGFVVGVEGDIQYADFGRNRNDFFSNGFGVANATPFAAGAGVAVTQPGQPGNVAFFNNAFDNDVSRIEWFATVRGRIGYAFDRILVYATGGVAFTDFGNGRNGTFGGFGSGAGLPAAFFVPGTAATGATVVPGATFGRRNNNDVGYAVGGGIEYAFTNNITAKIEGLYVNFDRNDRRTGARVVGVTNTGAPITQADFNRRGNETDFAVVRAGLNFKFNTF